MGMTTCSPIKIKISKRGTVMTKEFEKGYSELIKYKTKYGNTKVNYFYKTDDGYLLGKWVSRQRERNITGLMTDEERKALDAIGFIWRIDHREAQAENTQNSFMNFYEHLVAYKEKYEDCDVKQTYVCEDGYRLGAAVNKKRARPERLTAEQRKMLDDLGFVWKSEHRPWNYS